MGFETVIDLHLPNSFVNAAVMSALLTAAALTGLFAYLNRYTRKRYFTIWTTAWLFYALWLLLHLVWPVITNEIGIQISRQCSLGLSGVFLLWGSAEFLEQKAPQRVMTLFLAFVLVWSGLGFAYGENKVLWQLPTFVFLGIASIFAAASFLRFRRQYQYIGAGLLSFGFLMWGLFFFALPKLLDDPLAVTACFAIMDVLQLFLAVSMIVLVLEEVRTDVLAVQQKIEAKRKETTILHARVRSSEERYQTLFEQANEAIFVVGDELQIQQFNAAARSLLGIDALPPGKLRLTSFLRLPAGMPDQPLLSAWLEFFATHRQLELIRKDGSAASVEIQVAPIQMEHGAAIQFILREVTERVRLEQQLRQAEKLSALGQMMSGVAHELNNPLASVRGYAELMLTHHELSPQTRADLEKVASESDRAAKLVSQFLTFARAEAPQRAPVNLNELVASAVALREFEFRVAGVELKNEPASDLPPILADADKLQNVILNLLGNALQALCDHPQPRRVTIRTARSKANILLSVADNGPGIPPELVPRIFEPFFSTKEVGAGTGLGLSVVHSIMSDHGGRIHHEQTPGGGATFVIAFPVTEATTHPAQTKPDTQPAPAHQTNLTGISILVVDDEKPIAELLCEMLGHLGCHTVTASSGVQAMAQIRQRDFDVILSDYRMPNMNGEQFYEQLRKLKPHLARRVIFISGDVVNEQTQNFLKAVGNLHLAKPFNLSAVQAAIRNVLKDNAADASK